MMIMIKNIKIRDKIGNEFEVLDIIGGDKTNLNNKKTGFGVVYIVRDKNNYILALKTFPDKYINDSSENEKF